MHRIFRTKVVHLLLVRSSVGMIYSLIYAMGFLLFWHFLLWWRAGWKSDAFQLTRSPFSVHCLSRQWNQKYKANAWIMQKIAFEFTDNDDCKATVWWRWQKSAAVLHTKQNPLHKGPPIWMALLLSPATCYTCQHKEHPVLLLLWRGFFSRLEFLWTHFSSYIFCIFGICFFLPRKRSFDLSHGKKWC